MKNDYSKYVKKNLSLEELIEIINAWESWRGCEGEFIGDLDDFDENHECGGDGAIFQKFYGEMTYARCRRISRYWMYGYNFYANKEDEDYCVNNKIWAVTPMNIHDVFYGYTDEDGCEHGGFIDSIFDSFENYIEDYGDNFDNIDYYQKCYFNKINFKQYYKDNYCATFRKDAVDQCFDFINNANQDKIMAKIASMAEQIVNDAIDDTLSKNNNILFDDGTASDYNDDKQWFDDDRDAMIGQAYARIFEVLKKI